LGAWRDLHLLEKSRVVLARKRKQKHPLLTTVGTSGIVLLPRIPHLGLIPRAWVMMKPRHPFRGSEYVADVLLIRPSALWDDQTAVAVPLPPIRFESPIFYQILSHL
jgi:hypothetical protein